MLLLSWEMHAPRLRQRGLMKLRLLLGVLLMKLHLLPGYRYDPTGALIWFRAKRVFEEDQAADQPPAKKLVQPSLMKLWQK
mmetsp:Transcript_125858/g.218144  ORF Transcript_125858/g.218144 Transcript_125858/m.218144 type:complete len:81 (+) Transcript_125858:99-341(+)